MVKTPIPLPLVTLCAPWVPNKVVVVRLLEMMYNHWDGDFQKRLNTSSIMRVAGSTYGIRIHKSSNVLKAILLFYGSQEYIS